MSRWWLFGLGLVALIAAVVLWRPLDPSLETQLRHLPDVPGIVLLAEAPVIRALAGKGGGEEREFVEFQEALRFDYRRDLKRVLAVIGDSGNYFIVTGRFDWARLRRYAESHQGRCVKEVCTLPASQPGRHISFELWTPGVLLVAVTTDAFGVTQLETPRASAPLKIEGPLHLRVPGKWLARFVTVFEELDFAEAKLEGEDIVTALVLPSPSKAQEVERALRPRIARVERRDNAVWLRWKLTDTNVAALLGAD
jgi:hypothetical protein